MVIPLDLTKELSSLPARERGRSLVSGRRSSPCKVIVRDKLCLDFSIRDSLGYSHHPKLIKAANKANLEFGLSYLSTRLATGSAEAHRILEARICDLTGYKSALLFNTRNQAVLTLISCLMDERDCLLVGEDCQSPFVDAAHLTHTDCIVYDGHSSASLKAALERSVNKRTRLVVVDAISLESGSTAAIAELWPIIIAAKALLVLDETFSFGLIGARGGGIFDKLNQLDRPLASVIDFSALLGLSGAAIAGTPEVISFIIARSGMLASELPPSPSTTFSLLEALDLVELGIADRQKLSELVAIFCQGLKSQGWIIGEPEVPIINLKFDNYENAFKFQKALFERGLFVELTAPKVTRSEGCTLRFFVSLHHTTLDINYALEQILAIKTRG